MNSWTPLWNKIVDSSLWLEPDHVRIVFLTMLAIKDADHVVRKNAFELARKSNKTEEEVIDALKILSSPDTKRIEPQPYEGRRIERVEDGWLILNGKYYRDMIRECYRKEYKRKWMADKRSKKGAQDETEYKESTTTPTDNTRPGSRLHGLPSSVEEVIKYGETMNPPKSDTACKAFWDHYESHARTNQNGCVFWVSSGGQVITNWKSKLSAWSEDFTMNGKSNKHTTKPWGPDNPHPTDPQYDDKYNPPVRDKVTGRILF